MRQSCRGHPIKTPNLPGSVAMRGCPRSCAVDHAGRTWAVTLHSPDKQVFPDKAPEEEPVWCLVWLMAPQLGLRIVCRVRHGTRPALPGWWWFPGATDRRGPQSINRQPSTVVPALAAQNAPINSPEWSRGSARRW